MIYEEVTESNFISAFKSSNAYKNNFSYNGLKVLYEYLDDLSIDQNIELDIVAICCDYAEYEDIEEFKKCYTQYDHINTLEELNAEIFILKVGETSFITNEM